MKINQLQLDHQLQDKMMKSMPNLMKFLISIENRNNQTEIKFLEPRVRQKEIQFY